jgi:PhnB protein
MSVAAAANHTKSFQYHMTQHSRSFFAPELHIPKGTTNIDFYLAFGAKEHFCFRNDDGSIHVVEFEIDGAIFHLHETMRDALEPTIAKGVTAVIGFFVEDVQEVFDRAISAGATVINPVTDHDYGYRQGMFCDPFGHLWQIQKRISKSPSH